MWHPYSVVVSFEVLLGIVQLQWSMFNLHDATWRLVDPSSTNQVKGRRGSQIAPRTEHRDDHYLLDKPTPQKFLD